MGHRSKKARWLAVAAAIAMTYLTYAARRAEVEPLQFLTPQTQVTILGKKLRSDEQK